jgi:glucosamine kinase
LADEGSGNWLGRQLLKGFMNETLPRKYPQKSLCSVMISTAKLCLRKVYRQKQPALFLSSFTDFFIDNKEDNYLKNHKNRLRQANKHIFITFA